MTKKIGLTLAIILTGLIMWPGSKANASNTPLVYCDYEGTTPLVCSGATATVSSINTASPINGLASAYATWEGGITQRIDFNTPLTVATSGFTIAFKIDPTNTYNSWWISGYLNYGTSSSIQFSPYWNNIWTCEYSADPHWVIGTFEPTTLTWYNDNTLCTRTDMRTVSYSYVDWTATKPNSIQFFSGNYPILYDDYQVFDHVLTETEIQQFVDNDGYLPTGTNDYIMYYNDNPLYIPINGTDNILGVYNICENWDPSATYKIAAIDNDNKPNLALPGLEKTITSCSGVVKIPVNAPASDTMKNVKLAVKKNNKVILKDDSYFLLTIYTPVTEESYIMYYGDNPYYAITNNNLDLRIVYNICGEWDASKNFYLQLINSESGEPLANRQKITSCSGASRYTQKAGPTESSHTAKVIIYKEPNTTIAETETFIYSVYIPIDSPNWINTDLEPITYVNYETTESTDIKITYKIFYDNIKNSKICMIRKDANNLKTDLCYNEELTEGLNFFNIDIPSPEFETLQQISFGLFDGNQLIVESPTYIMSFLSNASISDNIENQLTGNIGWLGLNTRNLACSEAEWESESSFLGINLTKTICSIKKFTLDLTFLSGNITKDFYNSVISGVKNIFPFGLIYNIEKSWIASKNKPLPPDISWLAPGENLDIEVPKNWTKTDENITVTVFGSNIFKNGDPNIANFFAKIRALSTYLLWAGFIWSIYGFGNKFYHQHLKKPTEVDIK